MEGEMLYNAVEEQTHIPEKELKSDDDKQTDYYKNYKKQKKKWKELNANFGVLILNFLIVMLSIETFFLANYLLSNQFMAQVSDLTNEMQLLISRQPNLQLLILMEKEMIYTNTSA